MVAFLARKSYLARQGRGGRHHRPVKIVESFGILFALGGFGMIVIALGMVLPELAWDSPWDLFLALIPTRRSQYDFFGMVDDHIRANWPDTQLLAIFWYGGIGSLCLGALMCCLAP